MVTGKLRVLAAMMALMIFASVAASALAAGGFQAVVVSPSMKVYHQKAPHRYIGALPQGTTVTVKSYSGQAALISYNGRTGLAHVSDLFAVGATPPETPSDTSSGETAETATAAELAAAKAVKTNRATRVYSRPSKSASYVSVPSGMALSLLSVSGSVARVARGSVVGYTVVSHLTEVGAAAQPTEETPSTQTPTDSGVERFDRVAVATTASARIYAKPSTSSASVTVEKGTRLVLLAAKGNCAQVERDGRKGYVARNLLTTDIASVTPVAETPGSDVQTAEGRTDSVDYSGSPEDVIYKFLTRVAGYNSAAACGIMANIKYESDYSPTLGGDSGSSYGIVQWHASRKTRMINWCQDNGYDHATLKGQLYFLQYELKHYYPSVHNRLKAVSNTEQGAYDAGYDFCYNYEAPSNRASRSVTRGNYARSVLWARYKA